MVWWLHRADPRLLLWKSWWYNNWVKRTFQDLADAQRVPTSLAKHSWQRNVHFTSFVLIWFKTKWQNERETFFSPCRLRFNVCKSLFKQNQPKTSSVRTPLPFLWISMKLACVMPFLCAGLWEELGFLLAGGVGCWVQSLCLVCSVKPQQSCSMAQEGLATLRYKSAALTCSAHAAPAPVAGEVFWSLHRSENKLFFMALHIFALKLASMRARVACPINEQPRAEASVWNVGFYLNFCADRFCSSELKSFHKNPWGKMD